MSIEISIRATPPNAVMSVSGVLDSKTQSVFKQKSEEVLNQSALSKITLDFSRLQSLDASVSGMIMFFNHAAKSKNKTLAIANANPTVLQFLQKANLNKVMPIN
jgi:anti-anti-sigma factor